MQNSRGEIVLSSPSLLCQESHQTISSINDDVDYYLSIGQQQDDEYVEMLLDREINCNRDGINQEFLHNSLGGGGGGGGSGGGGGGTSWIKEARLQAIQYILDTSLSLGFKIETTYLAVAYLDRFLSRRLIEDGKYWAINLLAMACLSLASKMEECIAPLLSEFPGEGYNFESEVIRRMELLVLDTLEWRMALATPFTFTYYFASKFCDSNSLRDTISRVIEIISVALRNVKMIYHAPSAIAAAATLLILDQRLTRESLVLKINSLSSSNFLKIDHIVAFYNQMKEMDIERFKLSKDTQSPLSSPLPAVGSSTVTTSGVTAKRKSLTFSDDENDQNITSTMQDSKRHC